MSSTEDIKKILSSLFHSFERGSKAKAFALLDMMDKQLVIRSLIELISDPDPEARCDAAEALLQIDHKIGEVMVLPLLQDSIDGVRWYTCGLLHDFGSLQAASSLIQILLNDSDAQVRGIAAWALGEVGDSDAIPALRRAVETDSGADWEGRTVAGYAINAIQEIEGRV